MDKIVTHLDALEKLRSYCAYQDRCQQEVLKKLKSYRLTSDEIDYVLLLLIQGDYLNEERFAKSYCSGKFKIKQWGRIKIKAHLKQRNISEYCIKQGLKEIEDEDYHKTAETLIIKKWDSISRLKPYQKKQKVMTFMYGKGYEYNLVSDIISEQFDV